MASKKTIKELLSYIIPMVLVVPISILGISQMEKAAYSQFFVIGQSMEPFLNGDPENSYYGYSDDSATAIDRLERFDLIVCYYPYETSNDYAQPYQRNADLLDTATMKIKRVIGLPGDQVTIVNDFFSIRYTVNGEEKLEVYSGNVVDDTKTEVSEARPGDLVPEFSRKGPIEGRSANVTLGEDEYFVMGDNWTKNGSFDSCNPGPSHSPAPIYKENIAGVIISLEGVCSYEKLVHCNKCSRVLEKDSTKCRCGSFEFSTYEDIVDKRPFADGPIYLK